MENDLPIKAKHDLTKACIIIIGDIGRPETHKWLSLLSYPLTTFYIWLPLKVGKDKRVATKWDIVKRPKQSSVT